jgi:hypothetical protein
MNQISCLVFVLVALLLSSCVAHAPRTCMEQGYEKDSAEYNACISRKQQRNYYDGGGFSGGP